MTRRHIGYLTVFWKYPKLVLLFFSVVNIVVNFDLGAIGAILPRVSKNWGLSKAQEGAIGSAFTIGLTIASPLWANFTSRYRVNRIIAAGMFVFAIGAASATLWPSISRGRSNIWGYYLFVISRFVIGFGQASFLALCVTVIDDIAPAKYKSTYMSIFLSSTPFGIAAGYGIAGLVDAFVKWWQSIYFVEFLLSFSFAVLFLYVPLHGYDHTNEESTVLCESPSETPEVKYNLITVLKPLFTNVTYVCHLAASTQYCAVLGGLIFWGPTYVQKRLEEYPMSQELRIVLANFGFSAIVLLSSVFGTTIGGFLADKTGSSVGMLGTARSMFWCALYCALSVPFGLCVFLIPGLPIYVFFILLALATFFLICLTAPFQYAAISAVPLSARHFAASFQVFFLHALGDFPSPLIFGYISDALSMKVAIVFLWMCNVTAVFFFVVGGLFGVRAHRKQRLSVNG